MLALLWQDLRYGSRVLVERPGFTAVALLTLAVGIGANCAVFSLINEVFLRQPPGVVAPRRLALLGWSREGRGFGGFSLESYLEYRRLTRAFAQLAAYRGADLNLSSVGRTERVRGELVTDNYFAVLGLRPARGRFFAPEDNDAPVAVVSGHAWRDRFGADPDLVGKTVRLNGAYLVVVGIAPAVFDGIDLDESTDVWLPLMMERVARPAFPVVGTRLFSVLRVIGRLAPDATLESARAEAAFLGGALEALEPRAAARRRIVLSTDLRFPDPEFRGEARRFLTLLAVVVGLVLLIACANLASLLLARAAARRRATAIRLVLGATPARVLRQVLAEGILLGLAGGAAGIVLARGLTEVLLRLLSMSELGFRVDARVAGFTVVLSLVAAVLFGFAPALQAIELDLVPALKEGTSAYRSAPGRFRALLVALQVAISLVLLVGTALAARTLVNLHSIPVGYEADRVLALPIEARPLGYDETRTRALQNAVSDRAGSLPGVAAASLASQLPWRGWLSTTTDALPVGREPSDRGIAVDHEVVGPAYFATLGIELLRGREFTRRDGTGQRGVVIVNATAARRLWPEDDPLGKRVRLRRFLGWSPDLEVVGVARDIRYDRLEAGARPHVYSPLAQDFRADTILLARAAADPRPLRATLAAAVRELDPDLALPGVTTVAERLRDLDAEHHTIAILVALCGAFALVLAVVGLYGLVSYTVAQRSRELGIRMALGADRGAIARWALGQGLVPALLGVAAGLLLWVGLASGVSARLYGIGAFDPMTLGLAAVLLPLVALVASLAPARRAMNGDPAATLRAE